MTVINRPGVIYPIISSAITFKPIACPEMAFITPNGIIVMTAIKKARMTAHHGKSNPPNSPMKQAETRHIIIIIAYQ